MSPGPSAVEEIGYNALLDAIVHALRDPARYIELTALGLVMRLYPARLPLTRPPRFAAFMTALKQRVDEDRLTVRIAPGMIGVRARAHGRFYRTLWVTGEVVAVDASQEEKPPTLRLSDSITVAVRRIRLVD